MIIVILFGSPGSGKGTQSKKLVENHNLTHISIGDLLRHNMSVGTDLGKKVLPYINGGDLVPNEFLIEIVENTLKSNIFKGIVLDGFPRNHDQKRLLTKMMQLNNTSISTVIHLVVPEEEALRRIKERAKLGNRMDDMDDKKIFKRMRIYEKETLPLIKSFKNGEKFYTVDGMRDINVIAEHIKSIIEKL